MKKNTKSKKSCCILDNSLLLAIPFIVFLFVYNVICLGDAFNKTYTHSWWLSAGIVSLIICLLLTLNAFVTSKNTPNPAIKSLMFVSGLLLSFMALVQTGWIINEIHRNAFPNSPDWSAYRSILNYSNYVVISFDATVLFFTSISTYLKYKH